MKTQPVTTARLELAADGTPLAPDYGDVYHARAGALPQARHVFLAGNGLPDRWAGRPRFVILETGFGLGNNFLATWAAWRADPHRCERLFFLSVDKHPLRLEDLRVVHRHSELPDLAQALIEAWPVPTPNLHALDFDDARVQLILAWGDARDWMPQWQAEVDAFYLDGFSPARNPELWAPRFLERLGRLAGDGATAATWSVAKPVHEGLLRAGFEVSTAPGFATKREMTVARHRPRHVAQRPPGAVRTPVGQREVLIVGSGLAGCATAWALARQGWHATVLERAPAAASEASGNAGGLFHGTFNPDDGPHARWHRAGALRMARLARAWVQAGEISGRVEGLLRLDASSDEQARRMLLRTGLPPGYLQWWSREQASQGAGMNLPSGAWYYPDGGWLSPADVCRNWLRRSGADFTAGVEVEALDQATDGSWRALARDGRRWQAPHLVVATASTAPALLSHWLPAGWLSQVRGQTTMLPADTPGLLRPRLPVAGAGYALSLPDGRVLCGATSQPGDTDPTVRDSDHQHNLAQWRRLCGVDLPTPPVMDGRSGFRAFSRDRLPLLGPLPAAPFAAHHLPLRQRARLCGPAGGLYVLTGLGSRGLSTAALAAEVLASWITGCPCPVEADLRDAVDIARLFDAAPGDVNPAHD